MQIFWKNWDFSIFFSDTWSWCGGYLWRLDILGVLSCRLQMTHWDRSTGTWKHSRGEICKWPNLEKVKNCELLKERKMASIAWRNHCSCRFAWRKELKIWRTGDEEASMRFHGFLLIIFNHIISSSINNQQQNQQYHYCSMKQAQVIIYPLRSSAISSIVIIF